MFPDQLRALRNRSKLVALFATLLLLLTACGSSDSSGEGDSGGKILLGNVCTCSGPIGASAAYIQDTINAWVENTNAAGGINGHQVQVISIDDAGDDAKNLQAVRKLVEQDKVQAMVSYSSAVSAGATYLQQKGIPVIGMFDNTSGSMYFPTYFPVGGLSSIQAQALIGIAKEKGNSKFGTMYCVEAPGCKRASDDLSTVASSVGLGYTDIGIGLSAADYTAPCLAMKEQGVDTLFVQVLPNVLPKIIEQCASQDFKPSQVQIFGGITNASLKDPNLEGLVFWSPQANYQDETNPGVKTFADAMRKYAGQDWSSDAFGPVFTNSWASLEMFKAAAEAGKIGPDSDYSAIMDGLYALKDEDLGGLTPPQTYEKGKFVQPNCYYATTIQAGEFVGGTKPTCVDASLVN